MQNGNNGNGQKNGTLGGEITCIKVTKDTRKKLAGLGKKGDTYENVINTLLEKNCDQIMEEEE